MTTTTLPITSILYENRQRQDLGDLEGLAESIARLGLLQPPGVTKDNRLVYGGRRLHACKDILKWETIPVIVLDAASPTDLEEMELEENVRRKNLSWQEEVVAVCRIHRARRKAAILSGGQWTHEMTGELLGGYSKSYVYSCLDLEPDLLNPEGDIYQQATISDALRLKARKREDAALAILARRTPQQAIKCLTLPDLGDHEPLPDVTALPELSDDQVEIPISQTLFQGDCRDLLAQLPEGSVDHVITDWPYAIDMDNLEQATTPMMDVSRVEDTHQVNENLQLVADVIPAIYRVLKDQSYFVTWCDIMNWQYIYDLGMKAGFKVQRWPIVWCKTHICKNQCANFNITKNTEIAIIMRKGRATLPQVVSTSYILAAKEPHVSNPFAKPYIVWKYLIEAVSIPGQLILDPFAGEGSSTLAAVDLKRHVLAFEKEPTHFNNLLESYKAYWLARFKNITWK